jgi:hypothetical protein
MLIRVNEWYTEMEDTDGHNSAASPFIEAGT